MQAVQAQMPDNIEIINAKLVKVSTNTRRRREDDQSDAYQLVFDLFQKIVKSIATDENFDEADVAEEIAAIRTAAKNAGATLPAESATSVTTGSNDSTENDSQDNTVKIKLSPVEMIPETTG